MTPDKFGEELRQARLSKGRNLGGVSTELRVPQSQLKQFESGQFEFSELSVHQLGYLKSYVQLLDLDWADWRERLGEAPAQQTDIKRPQQQRLRSRVLSQQLRRGGLAVLVLFGLGGIVWVAGQLFIAPQLDIISPEVSELRISQRQLMVRGQTSAGSDVFINDTPVAVGLDGEFEENVLLARGVNRVQIVAINSLSRQAQQEIVVVVEQQSSATPE